MFKSLLPCGIFAEVNILRGNGCLLHVYGVSCYIKIASKQFHIQKRHISVFGNDEEMLRIANG